MKKTAILLGIVISATTFSQQKEYKFFEEPQQSPNMEVEKAPGDPGDPVPIDGYVPFLVLAGVGLIAWYGSRKAVKVSE
ncbi:MAG: hypothetical protein K0M63_09290 [Weeksellaceae bacterium]|nr:hypothetical protein [Weeksellaceae bacterium]